MSPTQQSKLTVLVKRFLDFIRILFLAVAVVWPVTVIVVGLSIADDRGQRHTDVSAFLNFRIHSEASPEQATLPDKGNNMIMKGRGNLTLNNTQSRLGWYVTGAISEILLLIFLFGLLIMRKLFASLVEGNTFTEENAERIRKMSIGQINTILPESQKYQIVNHASQSSEIAYQPVNFSQFCAIRTK